LLLNFRLFQYRADPEAQAAQASLKTMLVNQYNELGKPKYK
jgi:hypothetical protein